MEMENHYLEIVFTYKLKYMFSAGRWEAIIDRSLHYSYKCFFFFGQTNNYLRNGKIMMCWISVRGHYNFVPSLGLCLLVTK